MQRTYTQNNQLHALLMQHGLDLSQKEDLVHQYTHGRTTRSSKMHIHECQKLIDALRGQNHPDLLDRKRKRVIAHLAEAGYITPDGRPDMPAIYAWARRQKHKKNMNRLTSRQLSELIVAADGVKNHYLSKVRTP